jgi:tetratricopeptide (TPR) repeat protein
MAQEPDNLISESQASTANETAETRETKLGRHHYYSRETVLIISLVILALLSLFTAFITRMYHKKIHTLADQWFAEGEAALQAGDAKQALTDYRNALVYSPDNTAFQFHLAQALAAMGQGDQAQSYLLTLLDESPGSGQINLSLARIAARAGSVQDAVSYYHRAIYGVWEQNPLITRWGVRRELCEYLLDHGAWTQAEPELIALADQVPATDVTRLKVTSALLLRAAMWDRAFNEYRMVLNDDPHDEDALAGAGTAAFQSGRFADALYYLEKLSPENRTEPRWASMLETARELREANPYEAGISMRDKADRTMNAIRQAQSRLQSCVQSQSNEHPAHSAQGADLEKLYATSQEMLTKRRESDFMRDPGQIDAAMALVFQMEDAASQRCGAPTTGPDRILSLIEVTHQGGSK